jgi:N-acetylmuramoyl-L-alanine amidase
VIKQKPRIVIDAGHGGKDSGAVGLKGTMEKILALIYANDLKTALDKTGKYNVYLTRNSDFYIPLQERVNIARKLKGDLFISLHANSSMNHDANGLSIYILSQNASDTRTASIAERENKSDIISGRNLYGEYQYTINTLVDISRRKAMNDSKTFSKIFENELRSKGVKSHGGNMIKSANFAVLTSASMPSILLELGFISNVKEEKMIRSFNYKNMIINSFIKSLNKYFDL